MHLFLSPHTSPHAFTTGLRLRSLARPVHCNPLTELFALAGPLSLPRFVTRLFASLLAFSIPRLALFIILLPKYLLLFRFDIDLIRFPFLLSASPSLSSVTVLLGTRRPRLRLRLTTRALQAVALVQFRHGHDFNSPSTPCNKNQTLSAHCSAHREARRPLRKGPGLDATPLRFTRDVGQPALTGGLLKSQPRLPACTGANHQGKARPWACAVRPVLRKRQWEGESMSTPPPPPPPSSPKRRALHERSPSERNRLQIRLVPYSPPRLSSDAASPPTSAACPLSHTSDAVVTTKHGHSPHQGDQLPEPASTQARSPSPTSGSNAATNWTTLSPSSPSLCSSPSPGNLLSHATPSCSPPLAAQRRPKKVISVHSDKTFSLVPQSGSASSATDSFRSPRYSSTVHSTSYDFSSSDLLVEDRPSSPLTPLPEQPPSCDSPASISLGHFGDSPWNYRFVGGVRKVQHAVSNPVPPPGDTGPQARRSLSSSRPPSTLSERSNFKTYVLAPAAGPVGSSATLDSCEGVSNQSVIDLERANIDILGESSSDQSADDRQAPPTAGSESNYILHGGQSPLSAPSAIAESLRPEYSRESLLVPPLRTVKTGAPDRSILYRARSRDSIRTASLSSISTAVIEEATRSLFAGAVAIHMPGSTSDGSSNVLRATAIKSPRRASQNQHWSSALSTVISESEGGSAGPSRSLSPLSPAGHLAGRDASPIADRFYGAAGASSLAREEHIDFPSSAAWRPGSREQGSNTIRLIRDQDEHGDGLADLEELNGPFRARLYSFLSTHSSDRNLRSSGSSLYYGSGERRFLAAQLSSESLYSIFEEGARFDASLNRSPSAERLPPTVQNPRRRPREQLRQSNRSRPSQDNADQITPCPPLPVACIVRKQTSSIWSPHLARDRRFKRHTIWEPPSTIWSTDEPASMARNIQPILFVLAWMVASFLPLPSQPLCDMTEAHQSTGHLDLRPEASRNVYASCARRYSRAQWWRSLNRAMSVVGLFVVGAIVALIVTGVKQQWKS
ncbi:serine-rich protein [Purpureocillium lilacinum]|uniref:Serine-rich protein n=1 Tax=Purpureocillium lilacinum TaxID=33203 RepID=A0A179H2L0_PURLI|nr:serine-rich protein [Purpureocillium lilacinum]